MKTREDRIAFHMNYCEHYRPRLGGDYSKYCKAGVDLRVSKGMPCLGGHELPDATAVCPYWIRRTREAGEKYADAIQRAMERMTIVMPIVNEWRTWTEDNRVSKQEVIECPKCKGKLHLNQSSYNGHVHGHCETEGCVSWME